MQKNRLAIIPLLILTAPTTAQIGINTLDSRTLDQSSADRGILLTTYCFLAKKRNDLMVLSKENIETGTLKPFSKLQMRSGKTGIWVLKFDSMNNTSTNF